VLADRLILAQLSDKELDWHSSGPLSGDPTTASFIAERGRLIARRQRAKGFTSWRLAVAGGLLAPRVVSTVECDRGTLVEVRLLLDGRIVAVATRENGGVVDRRDATTATVESPLPLLFQPEVTVEWQDVLGRIESSTDRRGLRDRLPF